MRHGSLCISSIVGDDCEDGALKNLIDSSHLFAAALHVLGIHLFGDHHALLGGDRGEPLGFQHVDARLLVTEIRLQAHQDERCVRAEMKYLRVPLNI